jgi:hypothetical protein
MKQISIIILTTLLYSCATIDRMQVRHDNLYYNTKALKVIGCDNYRLVVENFTKQAVYMLRDDTLNVGDTIILRDNPGIYAALRFTNFRNLYWDPERGFYTFQDDIFIETNTLKEMRRELR